MNREPTYFLNVVQYTPEWWELRNGFPTASSFDKIITPKQGKSSGSQDAYIDELIGDLADLSPNAFTERGRMGTPDMERGRQAEPEARRFYDLERGVRVRECGFVTSACGRFGCSPDGLVEEGDPEGPGGLELKCPKLSTQARYLRSGGADLLDDYKCQVHGTLIVTGRPWWDLMSYAPGLEPVVVRVRPDEFTAKLAKELEAFWLKYEYAATKLLPRSRWPAAMRAARADQDAAEREGVLS